MEKSISIQNSDAERNSSSELLKTIVFYSNGYKDALAVIRLLGPAKHLGLKVIKGVKKGKCQIDAVRNGDIIIIQRDFCRDLNSYEQILSLAHAQKKPIVFDLDDLVFELPENHPDRISSFYADALLPMLQAIMEVDLVTVSTPSLRDYCLPYNENVVVIPNYLNDSLWNFKEPTNSTPSSEKVTIGYMGGHTHKPDVLMVLSVLEKIVKKYPQKVQFQFWGIEPPTELAPFSHVDWCPPKSSEYADFVSYFQTQTADIMIAPLCDNLFNSSKSPIKYFEYSAIGVPGVYSRVVPYSSMIEEGVDGYLVSSASEWEASLSKLIEDQNLRRKIALNAQQKIKQHWLLSQNAEKQMQIYIDAISNYGEFKHPFPSFYPIEKLLTRQTFNEQQHKTQQIKLLLEQLEERNRKNQLLAEQLEERNRKNQLLAEQLEEREKEVLLYAQSKSWRFTRPFRKISQNFKKGPR